MSNNLKSIFHHIHKPQGLLLVVCFMLLFSSCENDLSQLPDRTLPGDIESDRAKDVTIIYSEKGRTKAELHTKDFVGNENAKPPYIDFLNGIKMNMFDEQMQIESTVTARSARYYTQEENVIARDSVVVKNRKGEKLETEELIWNQKIARFYTDKFVRITYDGQVSWGYGLEATQDFSYVRIKEQRGSIPVAENDFPTE